MYTRAERWFNPRATANTRTIQSHLLGHCRLNSKQKLHCRNRQDLPLQCVLKYAQSLAPRNTVPCIIVIVWTKCVGGKRNTIFTTWNLACLAVTPTYIDLSSLCWPTTAIFDISVRMADWHVAPRSCCKNYVPYHLRMMLCLNHGSRIEFNHA